MRSGANAVPTTTSTPTPIETPTDVPPTNTPTEIPATKTPRPTNTPEPPTHTPTPDIPPGDSASVVNITDGDTIEVLVGDVQHTVRYIGIDTPERGEPLADQCTAANAALVAGQDVILVKDQSETDQYGRLMRYIFLEDGTFVSEELVRSGFPRAISYPPDTQYDNQFRAAETIAKASSSGIWGLPTSTPIPLPLPTSTIAPLPT
jgi:endonuclease YncB( thermonuclease family)